MNGSSRLTQRQRRFASKLLPLPIRLLVNRSSTRRSAGYTHGPHLRLPPHCHACHFPERARHAPAGESFRVTDLNLGDTCKAVGTTCAVVIASCEWPSTSITAGSFEEATYASRRTFEARTESDQLSVIISADDREMTVIVWPKRPTQCRRASFRRP